MGMNRLTDSGALVMEIAVKGDIIVHTATAAELQAALKEAGYAMVPVEPTEAMTVAGGVAWMLSHTSSMSRKSAADIYRAMLTASKEADDEG